MLNKKLVNRSIGNYIAILRGKIGLGDNTTAMEALALKDPVSFGSPFNSSTSEAKEGEVTTARLSNGITVVAETPRIPSTVTMGILMDVGTRDENSKTSGALHSLKTTYYKSFLRTNETINYGMVQMSGGRYNMDFSREHSIFKATCLSHDVVDIFTMMTDCAFEPRNFVSTNVAIAKLPHYHQLAKLTNSHHELTDKIFQACYGTRGLGNPLLGHEKNILNLDAYTMQQFQLNNIETDKIVVAGVNVEHAEEFFELAELRLGNLRYNQNAKERQASEFAESDVRNLTKGAYNSHAAIVFEAGDWKADDLLNYYLLSEMLGRIEVGNNDTLSTARNRLTRNVYAENAFIDSVEATNMHFTDSGLFIIRANINGDNVNKALELIAGEFKALGSSKDAELRVAKKKLKLKLMNALEDDSVRVEELLKQTSVYGKADFKSVIQRVDDISAASLAKTVQNLCRAKMTFVLESASLQNIHSHDKIKNLFA